MENSTVQLGSPVARPVAAQQSFRADWTFRPMRRNKGGIPVASADSGELEVWGRWERGLGATSEWKNPDWSSLGGRGFTDKAIRGGAC
jgi:hypothetical protein